MRSSIGESFPDADVSGCVVWINMLDGDTEVTARESARIVADSRFRHFHDPERQFGRLVARRMGAEGKVAWDVYLFFAEGAEWVEDPPPPTDWIHQLSASWADPARLRFGDGLAEALRALMRGLAE